MTQDMGNKISHHNQAVARELAGSRQALGRLMSMARSRQGAGKEQARSKQGAGYSMGRVWLEHLLVRPERTLGTSGAYPQSVGGVLHTLRYAVCLILMMFVGVSEAWGQHPFTLTTASDITNGTQHYYLIQSIERPSFYAIPHSNSDGAKVSTTSIPNANMRWCFVDAGSDSDHQYYFIVNSTGRCLYRNDANNDGIRIKKTYTELSSLSDAELNKYKFYLTQTESDYFIQPKGFPGQYLNKRAGNIRYESNYYIKSSTYNDAPSVWNFVAVGSVTWTQPFTVSTNSEKHYYKFQNVTNTSFYLSNSDEWATVSSAGGDKDIWYFLAAGNDATYSNFHYYYIVNASTGKYLYHTGGTGDDVAKVLDYNSTEDDKYRFLIVDAAYKPDNTNFATGYTIVPKLRQTYFYDKDSYAPMAMSDGSHLLLKIDRTLTVNSALMTNFDTHWDIVATDYVANVEAPTITNNFDGTITLNTTTDGATIYYTTNGDTPDNTSTEYSSAFSLGNATVIKAIAYKESDFSDVTTYNVPQYTAPTITFNSATLQVTITSEGTVYYTTDNSAPTTSGTAYSAPFTVSSGATIKAIATHEGYLASEVATQTIEKLVSPSVSFDNATQKVNITTNSTVEGVVSVYTTDDNNPTTSSTAYSEAISLTGTTTVKAMTVKNGYINSDVVSLTVTKLASSPTISVSGSNVTLSYTGDGTEIIHYTTDGTTPSLESDSYSTALTLDGNQKYTIKAIATKSGYLHSDGAEDVIDNRSTIPAPTITYSGNTVTITASDASDEIYYTTDGTPPTTSTLTKFTGSGSFTLAAGSSYPVTAIAAYKGRTSESTTVTVDLTDSGYSGIYYIQNNANNGAYYMYPVGSDAYVKTDKKTDKDAIWKIEMAGDYYRIIHYESGKYLVAAELEDGSMPETNTVSLVDTDSPGENALFEITRLSGDESNILGQTILIRPKAATNTTNETHIYLNTTSGNDGTHTIGLYDNTGSSVWKLAKVPAKPTFTVADVKVTMATSLGDIYYTIDGSTPSFSSTKGKSVTLKYGPQYTVKAISIYADPKSGETWQSDVASQSVKVAVLPPAYTVSGNTVLLSSSQAGVSFRFTTDDGVNLTATTGDAYNNTTGIVLTNGNAYNLRVLAYNTVSGTNYPSVISTIVVDLREAVEITSLAGIVSATGNYKLASSFTATGTPSNDIGTSSSNPFKGTIDGQLNEFSLSQPLFDYVEDAIIKNVMLKDVKISKAGPVGAIAGTASGYTRIYNCGILPTNNKYVANSETSYVESTGNSAGGVTDSYCGGLVGWLKDDSRVINCFSYANIKGGTDVAGIVGHNETVYTDGGVSYGSTTQTSGGKYYRLKTAVVNCMFYGNITGGTNRYPVYGGAMMRNDIDNGINNYDFYRAEASLGLADDNHYNCSWPAPEDYLTQHEFYRNLLNSNRELCGWWVGASSAPSGLTTAEVQAVPKDASLMAKWVLDPSIAPYPILKPAGYYPSVINRSPRSGETNPQRIDPETKQWVSRASSSNTEMKNPVDAPETDGRSLGKITVTIKKNSDDGGTDKDIIITAMDVENNDFCYGKIQLPYYNTIFGDPTVQVNSAATLEARKTQWNQRYGGNYNEKVVVGWEITSVTGGITGVTDTKKEENGVVVYDHAYSTNAESGYNFADRYCTTKDENRIFAQGGYYYVPYGVSQITITAKWANAIYLDNSANHDYECVRMSAADIGKRFLPAGTRPTALANGQTIKTGTINANIPNGGSVYENAIVLVGNHQYRAGNTHIRRTGSDNTSGCSIMSADFDLDEEPDYCLIWQLGNATSRYHICPIRFDFLPVVEIGLAMKQNASTQYYALGCYRPLGHFEVTETALIRFGQFEFGNSSRGSSAIAPLILNGGIFEQYVKGTEANGADKDYINYIILGGNVRMPSFTPGAHVRNTANKSTRHCPVNVIGGYIDNLYLTGNYNENVAPNTDNPHCYIDGGNFKQVAAAGKEGINGDVYFNINHSIMQEFYGGSTMDKADGNNFKIVKGNINVTIDNSMVTKYCGGPKFGNMIYDESTPANSKKVTTNATGTTFGVYYGGGNGGTSYVQYSSTDVTVPDVTAGTYSWTSTTGDNGKLDGYTPGTYRSGDGNKNYMADYDMEIVNTSTGTDGKKAVFRTYFYAAQFSATNTGPITNNLTDCKVLTNFYGGGNLGGVKGNVTSKLMGATHVEGSVYGAGYSASIPEVTIYNKDKEYPTINIFTGIITPTPESSGTSTTYTWTHETSLGGKTLSTSNPKALDVEGKNYFYTEVSLDNLGTTSGNVEVTITDDTIIEGKVFNEDGTVDNTKIGGVFGGGAQSAVTGDTTVNLQENAQVYGNVFGGGDEGVVEGTATVNIGELPTSGSGSGSNTGGSTGGESGGGSGD